MKSYFKQSAFRVVNWVSRRFFASRLSFAHIEAFVFCNSFKKFSNFILANWEKRTGVINVKSKPYLFVFEVTNVCNLKCPFCVTGKGISGGRKVGHLGFEDAKKILDEVSEHVYLVQLYTWGEPLLNKDIYKIISYAKSKGVYVMLSTNATVMNEANNKKLIECGLDYVMVAVDGGSNETYKKYRVGGNYDTVLKNIKDLISQKKESKMVSPFIEWQFIVFRHNEHEVADTERMAYDIGINKFTPLPAYVEDESWRPDSDKYKVAVFNPERLSNCDRPWSHLNIRADGGVASCCYEFNKGDDFADALTTNFSSYWNNSKFTKSRELIVQKRKGLPVEKSDIICYNCLVTGVRPSYVDSPTDTQIQSNLIEVKQLRG